ncbi:carbon-nitrogen hydrolase family protein [Acuticoccus sp. MNP-M23]|uniref:carbon-nitrogen hydrolase family protein n=1 Tax=Acuticoccus sp. MNP-M23 TaxID=3072793 RepID=UPI0028156E4A|nr:carbon-nitrogen hydrolase family protein [Acuticoccus sp. MNP-M23]WMS42848.1 carbon-nitrogen hydrolase family protein [Acuticoccus sp. MNP-M23]
MKLAALQLRSTRDPFQNADTVVRLIREAAALGARYIQTPELTNLVEIRRKHAAPQVREEADEPVLSAVRPLCAELGVTVHLGSLIVREGEQWCNRGYMIGPGGDIEARYDKLHMFDVDLPSGQSFRESSAYRQGETAVLVDDGPLKIGMAICFDLRFPRLFEELANEGANVLTAPSAFATATGDAHWHVLLRARAIENAAFMVAAAQEGLHEDGRTTYGHAMIVDPWGRVLAEATETPSVIAADIDLSSAAKMRAQIPTIAARHPSIPVAHRATSEQQALS